MDGHCVGSTVFSNIPMSRRFASLILLVGQLLFSPGALHAAEGVTAPAEHERTWSVARELAPLRLYRQMSPAIEYSEVRIMEGDDPRWAAADWDDRSWRVLARDTVPAVPHGAGIMWLRFRVRWSSDEGRLPGGMHLWNMQGSYEWHWDGVLLLRSGTPGHDARGELVGLSQNTVGIPDHLTGPGEHVVAMRVSTWHATWHRRRSTLMAVMVTPADFDAGFRRINVLPVMASGALVTVAFSSLVMWGFAARRRVLLLFSALCLCAGVLEAVTWYSLGYAYPYSWAYGLRVGAAGAAFALSLLLGAIVVEEWKLPHGRRFLTGLLLVDVALVVRSMPAIGWLPQELIGTAFIFLLLCSMWAARHRRDGAWIIAIVVLISGALLVHDPLHFVGTDFFQDFLPVISGLVVVIALGVGRDRRAAQETRLTAVRLEIELLKKSLQPHFLMNTLTALAQTVEENPAGAVKLIDDLADEFRSLARMSGEKRVALARELELCRAHLRVMRARTDVDWRLDVNGIDPNAEVPPALFLTLIENGFSHQRPRPAAPVFNLRAEPLHDGGTRYTFMSPGEVAVTAERVAGGTGLRYVRARLEESFPAGWTMEQGAVDGGWQTVIELRGTPRGGALP